MNYYTCCECNRFMSYRDLDECVRWTPYGGPTDLEEPDEEFCHRRCWKRMEEKWRELIRVTSWHKPWSLGHRM